MNPIISVAQGVLLQFMVFASAVALAYFVGGKFSQKLKYYNNEPYAIVRKYDNVVVCTPLPRSEARRQFSRICKQYEEWAYGEYQYRGESHQKQAEIYFQWRNSLEMIKAERVTQYNNTPKGKG